MLAPSPAPPVAATPAPPPDSSPAPPVEATPSEPPADNSAPVPGPTKVKVLRALSPDIGLTAAEVAAATGIARATVASTLSRLVKSGEAVKAERGYRLPDA
jgi:biotin operon repressor